MVRHIVLWRFLDRAGGRDKMENLSIARSLLLSLKRSIPVIVDWEVAITSGTSKRETDLALNSTFGSFEDLTLYQQDPEHQKVVEFLRSVHAGKVSADYEFDETL
jgi:Stress responsive A/B Barrel Domain